MDGASGEIGITSRMVSCFLPTYLEQFEKTNGNIFASSRIGAVYYVPESQSQDLAYTNGAGNVVIKVDNSS
jgi:hypothetical protein